MLVSPRHTPHSEEGPCYPHLTDEETEALPKVTRLTHGGGGFKSRLPDTSASHPPPPNPSTLAHTASVSLAGISLLCNQDPHLYPRLLTPLAPSSSACCPLSCPSSHFHRLSCVHSSARAHSELHAWAGLGLQWPLHTAVCSPLCSMLSMQSAPPHTGGHGTLLPLASPSLVSPHPPPGSFLGDSPVPTSSLLCAHLPPQLLTPHTPLLGHQLPSLLAQVSLLSPSLPPCSPLGKVTCPRHPPVPRLRGGGLLSYPLPQGCRGSLFPHDWSGCISLPFTSLVNAFSLRKSIFSLMKYYVSCRDVLVKRHHKEAEKQISQCISTQCKPS